MSNDVEAGAEQDGENTPARRKMPLAVTIVKSVAELVSPAMIVGIIGVLVIAVVAVFGGWEEATAEAADDTPVAKPDETLEIAPIQAEVHTARWADELDGLLWAEAGSRYLIVKATLTNTQAEPIHASIFQKQFTLDVEGLAMTAAEQPVPLHPSNLRVIDALPQATLQPAFPATIVLVWKQSVEEPPPTELTVVLNSMTFSESAMGTGTGWRDPEPAYRVTLPVEEVKAP